MKVVGVTYDSMSFGNIDLSCEVEIPCGNHVGAFGTKRKFDTHKGVDLYCFTGENVHAVEDGTVVDIRWFTGEKVDMPWWNNTMAVSVEGEQGVVVYGEVEPKNVQKGDKVKQGDVIAQVRRVLIKNKNRPTTMLHFALHHHNVLSNGRWDLDKTQPTGLMDPTNRLIASVWEDTYEDLGDGRIYKGYDRSSQVHL